MTHQQSSDDHTTLLEAVHGHAIQLTLHRNFSPGLAVYVAAVTARLIHGERSDEGALMNPLEKRAEAHMKLEPPRRSETGKS